MRNIRIITALLAGSLLTLSACAVTAVTAVTAAPPPLPAPVATTPTAAEVTVAPEPACPVPSPEAAQGEWTFSADPVKYLVEVTPASGQGGFRVSQLQAYPVELEIGDNVTISVLVTNTGIQPGNYTVTLKFDDAVIWTQDITIDGGISKKLELSVMPPLGEFVVAAGELTAGLKVVF